MRVFVFLLIYVSISFADILQHGSVGDDKSDAIENAKQNIAEMFTSKMQREIGACEYKLDADVDDFDIELLNILSITKDHHKVTVNANYDVELKNQNLRSKILSECRSIENTKQMKKEFSEFMSRFHLGVGAYGWVDVYSLEGYLEYEFNKHTSLYINATKSQFVQSTEDNYGLETITGDVNMVGFNLRLWFFILGYEKVVGYDIPKDKIVEEPSGAFVWGFVYPDDDWEYGLVFKELDTKDIYGNDGLTGGAFVRYRFF
jgi:hypothetical protein